MITRAPRSKHPPGWMLLAIADWTFPDDPIADSLKALIADAQREWAGAADKRRVHVELVASFWLSIIVHSGRLLVTPDRHVLRLTNQLVAFGSSAMLAIAMLVKGSNFSLTGHVTECFIMFSGMAASVLHPANIAERIPSATPRGWWRYGQFLLAWLTAFAIWLYVIDGSCWLFILAVANTGIGMLFSRWLVRALPKTRA